MILFIEGPRAVGKTYLINHFIEYTKTNSKYKDFDVEYYKFHYTKHIHLLLCNKKDDPNLHYFGLGNVLTILEMNTNPIYKDKIWIFDRALITTYVWATLYNRLKQHQAQNEFLTILHSDLYQNCKTLVIEPSIDRTAIDLNRNKDQFGGEFSTYTEYDLMDKFINLGHSELTNQTKDNSLLKVLNHYNDFSKLEFIETCNKLLL